MSGKAPEDLDARRAETLGAVESSTELSALEELRVRTLGKSGWVTEKLKTLGKLAEAERKEGWRGHQPLPPGNPGSDR